MLTILLNDSSSPPYNKNCNRLHLHFLCYHLIPTLTIKCIILQILNLPSSKLYDSIPINYSFPCLYKLKRISVLGISFNFFDNPWTCWFKLKSSRDLSITFDMIPMSNLKTSIKLIENGKPRWLPLSLISTPFSHWKIHTHPSIHSIYRLLVQIPQTHHY